MKWRYNCIIAVQISLGFYGMTTQTPIDSDSFHLSEYISREVYPIQN